LQLHDQIHLRVNCFSAAFGHSLVQLYSLLGGWWVRVNVFEDSDEDLHTHQCTTHMLGTDPAPSPLHPSSLHHNPE